MIYGLKKNLDENNANRLIKETPNVYQDYLTQERSLSKFTLQEQEEKIINILDVTGIEALLKIYDRMTNGFEFEYIEIKGKRKIKKIFTNKEKLVSLVKSAYLLAKELRRINHYGPLIKKIVGCSR